MEIDSNGNSVNCDPPPSEPPPSDPPPTEPIYTYQPPHDVVEPSTDSQTSSDASGDDWRAGTLAAAEEYARENPRTGEFGWKPAEERAQDAFWKNDPNRPAPQPAAPPPPPSQPEEDDRDPKNPMNKPQEPPTDPSAPGPDLPGGKPIPPNLMPKPEPPPPRRNGANDFSPVPPPPPPRSTPLPPGAPLFDLVNSALALPVHPTKPWAKTGDGILLPVGVRSNPPPTNPTPVDPTSPHDGPKDPPASH